MFLPFVQIVSEATCARPNMRDPQIEAGRTAEDALSYVAFVSAIALVRMNPRTVAARMPAIESIGAMLPKRCSSACAQTSCVRRDLRRHRDGHAPAVAI